MTGRAVVDGHDCATQPLQVRRSLGVLPHASGLYAHLTGRENIRYYGRLHGLAGRRAGARDRRADRAARPGRGRGSTRQGLFAGRAAEGRPRARAVHRPQTIILDEPTNGLDVNAVRMLRELIRELRASGRCVLFSSHVMQEVAALCDDIVIISHGRVVVRGTPGEILAATGAPDLEEAFVRAADGGERCVTRAVRIVFLQGAAGEPARSPRHPVRVLLRRAARAADLRRHARRSRRSASCENQDKPLALTVVGRRARAEPDALPRRERRRGRRRPSSTPDAAISAVRTGKHDLVLLIDERVRHEAAGRRARAARSRRRYGEQPDVARAQIARGDCSKRTAASSRRCGCSCAASARK